MLDLIVNNVAEIMVTKTNKIS